MLRYLMGIYFRFRSVLIVPCVYVYALYCCVIEFLLDVFCDMPLKMRADEWSKSSLLKEHPQQKRIAVMTGADGTIGTEVSRLLLEFGFEVVIFGLRRPRLSFLKDWDRLHLLKCDLLVINQVHKALNEFQERFEHVDLIVFNAGIMFHPQLDDAKAIDPHYTVNLLSHAMMFDALRPFLEKSPRTAPKVIALSSSTLHFGDVQQFIYGDPVRAFRCYVNGYKSYCDSKLYTSLYFRYVSDLVRESRVRVATLHPGVVPGNLYRHVFPPIRFLINHWLKFIIRKSNRAAIEVLSLAFNDRIHSGYFYEHTTFLNFDEYPETHLRRLYEAVQHEIR
ncbi:Retinol dehydrogenase 12 [Aphelenchoides besseyi]|nr:Retinol dehydrogenase 12 [Aphelenchoides besseyi]KAI6209719.1 Retinol dehydrogenase 12 [Aphelenchoides besseyi]